MNDQLKAFLCSLLCQLVNYRTQSRDLRGDYRDWANWGRISGRIDLALELGLLTHDQWVDLHRLLFSASDCLGKPFPHPANAGPVMPWRVLHLRREAAVAAKPAVIHMGGYDFVDAGQAKPPVQSAEPASRPSWLRGGLEALEMVRADMAAAEPFVDESEYLEPCPACEGNGEVGFAPCSFCAGSARVPADVKPQARDSANEKHAPVPAPTSRPGLRLLCLLDETGGADSAKPVATVQQMPPRPRINGQWPSACRAPLVLRDTQARCPTAEVLARCVRHRQTNAFRTAARTI